MSALPLSAQTLRIYTIDVEQADSHLIVMPNGKTLLSDSGKNGMGPRIKAVMDQAGVTHIDAFVDTHSDGKCRGGDEAGSASDFCVPVMYLYPAF